jgi:hypothetical protein
LLCKFAEAVLSYKLQRSVHDKINTKSKKQKFSSVTNLKKKISSIVELSNKLLVDENKL